MRPLFKSKWFKTALIVNLCELLLAIIVNNTPWMMFNNDFKVFYTAGQLVKTNIQALYDPSQYNNPYRYMPFAAVLFTGFTVLPELIMNYIFWIILYFVNILVALLIYYIAVRIYTVPQSHLKILVKLVALYLAYIPHWEDYNEAQINSILTILLLLSIICFESTGGSLTLRKGSDFTPKDCFIQHPTIVNIVGGLLLGIAITFKPIFCLIVPFIILIRVDSQGIIFHFKESFLRLLGVFIGVVPNFIIFLKYPSLWTQFINTNFSGSAEFSYLSISVSRQILTIGSILGITIPALPLLVIIILPLYCISFVLFLIRSPDESNLAIYYSLAITVGCIGYFDTWGHHLVFWGALGVFPVIKTCTVYNREGIKLSDKSRTPYRKLYICWLMLGVLIWSLFYLLSLVIFPYALNPIHAIFLTGFYIFLIQFLFQARNKFDLLKKFKIIDNKH